MENRKIKLIWDFYGGDAQGTAEHHTKHLQEFMVKESLDLLDSGVQSNANEHFLAYITVNELDVKVVRDALKPNRAFVVE